MIKLGISAFYHDSAACLFKDDKVLSAVEEERFTGIKHDYSFPINSINYVLESNKKTIHDVDLVCWYENDILKKDRIQKTFNKRPFSTFFLKRKVLKELKKNDPLLLLDELGYEGPVRFVPHHLSHANFAYYTSNYKDAAILTIDGVGEWDTATISLGRENEIVEKLNVEYPNSLGLLYSTVTAFLGFKPNEGEYKVMGLAPYGDASRYFSKLEKVINTTSNKFFINQKYFTWEYSDKIMFTKSFSRLLGLHPRLPNEEINQNHKDLAAAIQKIYEREFLRLVKTAKHITKSDNLCIGGGCAYNGVANAKAYKYFKSVYVPFAPSDAGSAIGAVLNTHTDISPYLGPSFSNKSVRYILNKFEDKLRFYKLKEDQLISKSAELLAGDKVVAWFQGSMEFGARALGNRSILASARKPEMREKLNRVIKKRESFRPFAPVVIQEQSLKYFKLKEAVPYMNQVVESRTTLIPAATHIDGSSRVQTVNIDDNYKLYRLLEEYRKLSGVPVLLNTSFNFKDQTITLSPYQAISRFLNSKIDVLVINNYLIFKK